MIKYLLESGGLINLLKSGTFCFVGIWCSPEYENESINCCKVIPSSRILRLIA